MGVGCNDVGQQQMDDSFASAEEGGREPNNLFLEIKHINADLDGWQENFEFSPNVSRREQYTDRSNQENASFDFELPLESKMHAPLLEAQQALLTEPQILPPDEFLPPEDPPPADDPQPAPSALSSQGIPQQLTITMHQQSMASKIYEQIDTDDCSSSFSTSLRSFLSLNQKNYRPHLICLKFLFQKLKDYSRRSLDNLRMYISFLEIKVRQELSALQIMDRVEVEPHQEEDDVSMDEKVLLKHIAAANTARRDSRRSFLTCTKELQERLMGCWRKIKERREKRERYMEEEIILVIDRIELEMQDMIKCRLLNEREKADSRFVSEKIRSGNPYLTKDRYLEVKYLMQREGSYLKLITDFNGKLITYLNSMFAQEEVQICKALKEAMLGYAALYMDVYTHDHTLLALKVDALEQSNCEREVRTELANHLLTILPRELYNFSERNLHLQAGDRLEPLLADFSASLQNTIFLTTIEMNNEYVLFRNEATWKTSSSFLDKEENAIDFEAKQLAHSATNTHQLIHPTQQRIQSPSKSKEFAPTDLKITVVLTSNYYLHLEHEEKIATMKLGEVKLSRKGREVIVADRGKGLGGLLGWKKELGRLEFETTDEVDIFASKLSLALRRCG